MYKHRTVLLGAVFFLRINHRALGYNLPVISARKVAQYESS